MEKVLDVQCQISILIYYMYMYSLSSNHLPSRSQRSSFLPKFCMFLNEQMNNVLTPSKYTTDTITISWDNYFTFSYCTTLRGKPLCAWLTIFISLFKHVFLWRGEECESRAFSMAFLCLVQLTLVIAAQIATALKCTKLLNEYM